MAPLKNPISFLAWCSVFTMSLPEKIGALQGTKKKKSNRPEAGLLSTLAEAVDLGMLKNLDVA